MEISPENKEITEDIPADAETDEVTAEEAVAETSAEQTEQTEQTDTPDAAAAEGILQEEIDDENMPGIVQPVKHHPAPPLAVLVADQERRLFRFMHRSCFEVFFPGSLHAVFMQRFVDIDGVLEFVRHAESDFFRIHVQPLFLQKNSFSRLQSISCLSII